MRRTVAALLVLAAAPALGATFVATSVEEVARSSDAVVRGRVLSRQAHQTRDGRIVTEVELEVLGAWKGSPERVLRFVVPGGSLGTIALSVDAAPTFGDGEQVVVFLAREGPAWVVAGWSLGKFRVDGTEARPGLGNAQVLPRAIEAGERQVEAMPLAELERRVRAAR
jgi:hypothetical protein